jgi:hypothetical protein
MPLANVPEFDDVTGTIHILRKVDQYIQENKPINLSYDFIDKT